MLDLDFASDVPFGALPVTKLTTLDGGLAIDLIGGFTLATHDSFDILTFGSLMGGFDALTLDGVACEMRPMDDLWACAGGVRLKEVIDAASFDLVVTRGPGRTRTGREFVADPRTFDLDNACVGLPRPRRPGLAQARGSAFARTVVAQPSATAFGRGMGRVEANRKARRDWPAGEPHAGLNEVQAYWGERG